MLRVKLTVNGEDIGQLTLHNDGTGTQQVGNYDGMYYVGEGKGLALTFRVEGHQRAHGALTLVGRAIKELGYADCVSCHNE